MRKMHLIRNKYILDNVNTVICGCHHINLKGARLLWFGNFLPNFRRIVLLSSYGYESDHELVSLMMKAVSSFAPSARNDPTTRHKPKDLLPQYDSKFTSN